MAMMKKTVVTTMKTTERIKDARKSLFLETKVIMSAYREDKFM